MQRKEFNPADIDCVVNAANYLEVSEFVIFSDAFTAWYGKKASEKQVEKIFLEYIVENKVPFWVRNYARSRAAGNTSNDQVNEYSRTANNFLYLATIIAEYVLLASYLVIR
jgi:hypothetical protein